jgi:EVE domain
MAAWLLTWNPERWAWVDLARQARRVAQGKELKSRWGCGNSTRIRPGDRFFLLRQGKPPRGIVGSGRMASAPYRGPHWDAAKDARGVPALYVDVVFEALLDTDGRPPLSVAELTRGPLSRVHWRTHTSGIRIADDATALLETLWHKHAAGRRLSVSG